MTNMNIPINVRIKSAALLYGGLALVTTILGGVTELIRFAAQLTAS